MRTFWKEKYAWVNTNASWLSKHNPFRRVDASNQQSDMTWAILSFYFKSIRPTINVANNSLNSLSTASSPETDPRIGASSPDLSKTVRLMNQVLRLETVQSQWLESFPNFSKFTQPPEGTIFLVRKFHDFRVSSLISIDFSSDFVTFCSSSNALNLFEAIIWWMLLGVFDIHARVTPWKSIIW